MQFVPKRQIPKRVSLAEDISDSKNSEEDIEESSTPDKKFGAKFFANIPIQYLKHKPNTKSAQKVKDIELGKKY